MIDKEKSENEQRLQESRQYWNNVASTFDDTPDHGLHNPEVREAWAILLKRWLPPSPATILDIGCGTGSISVLLAELGYLVTGIDLSPEMIALAKVKARSIGNSTRFHVMDAAHPELDGRLYDAIFCRHLLWTLTEPRTVITRWKELLKPGGRILLIEGYWEGGVGLHAQEIIGWLPTSGIHVRLENMNDNPQYWGKEVSDERYLLAIEFEQ